MNEEEMEKAENFEHEVLDRLKLLNELDFDRAYLDESYIDAVLKARNIILKLYNRQEKMINKLASLLVVKSLDITGRHTNCTYDITHDCRLNEEGCRKYSCKECVKKYFYKEILEDE